MHAFLILKATKDDILKLAKKENAKVIYFPLQKIEDSRNLKKIIKYSFPEKTAIIIEDIDTATTETVNSFLKDLEEPNENLIYILTARFLDGVLPTIISRCEVIKTLQTKKILQNEYKEFLNLNIDEKFNYINKIKDRKEAIDFIENLVLVKHGKNDFKLLTNYLNTLKNLNANGNVSLQLTNLLITSFS